MILLKYLIVLGILVALKTSIFMVGIAGQPPWVIRIECEFMASCGSMAGVAGMAMVAYPKNAAAPDVPPGSSRAIRNSPPPAYALGVLGARHHPRSGDQQASVPHDAFRGSRKRTERQAN